MRFCACTTYRLKVPFKDLLPLSTGLTAISATLICEPLQGRLQAQTLIIISSDINQTPCCSTPTEADYCYASFSCLPPPPLLSLCLKVLPVGNCQAKLTQTKNVSAAIAHRYKLILNLSYLVVCKLRYLIF